MERRTQVPGTLSHPGSVLQVKLVLSQADMVMVKVATRNTLANQLTVPLTIPASQVPIRTSPHHPEPGISGERLSWCDRAGIMEILKLNTVRLEIRPVGGVLSIKHIIDEPEDLEVLA